MRRVSTVFLAVAALLSGLVVWVVNPASAGAAENPAPQAANEAGTYRTVPQFSADERDIVSGKSAAVQIGGRRHVPSHVEAVAITLVAETPTTTGRLVAYPDGGRRPAVTDVSYRAGHTSSNVVVRRLSAHGVLRVANLAPHGKTRVDVVVTGYFVAGRPSSDPGVLHALSNPVRVLNPGHPTSHKHGARNVTIGGRDGVPQSGVGAALVSVSTVSSQKAGGWKAYSRGNYVPTQRTGSFAPGHSSTTFAVVPTDDTGAFTLRNDSDGDVSMAVDLVGWLSGGVAGSRGALQTRFPGQIGSTTSLAGHRTRTVRVVGAAGVPLRGVDSLLATVTVSGGSASGSLKIWARGPQPKTNRLYFDNSPVSTETDIRVSLGGTVQLHNNSAKPIKVSLVANGFTPSPGYTPPRVSTGRYVRTRAQLDGAFSDASVHGQGCADARSGSKLVLLDLGAELNDGSGVALSVTGVPVTWHDLVAEVNGYDSSFAKCARSHATVAIGTNNDGDFKKRSATDRGRDWANKVIDAVDRKSKVTVAGADDIEPGFQSTEAQAEQWEQAYLAATRARLVFNGSADDCPVVYGSPGKTCAYGWTELQINGLAHDEHGRIVALPQIYDDSQATQWANIDQTGVSHGLGRMRFIGALTEYGTCPSVSSQCTSASLSPGQGWTALRAAIGTVEPHPSIPTSVDLRIG